MPHMKNKESVGVAEVKKICNDLEVSPSCCQPNSPIYAGGSKSAPEKPTSELKMPAKGKPKHSGSGNKY